MVDINETQKKAKEQFGKAKDAMQPGMDEAKKIASNKFAEARASIRADIDSGGIKALLKNKYAIISCVVVLFVSFFIISIIGGNGDSDRIGDSVSSSQMRDNGGSERMPADLNTIKDFLKRVDEKAKKVEVGSNRDITDLVKVAKEIIEEMGYDYDKTLFYCIFNAGAFSVSSAESRVFAGILTNPYDKMNDKELEKIKNTLHEETYLYFKILRDKSLNLSVSDTSLDAIEILYNWRNEKVIPYERIVKDLTAKGVKNYYANEIPLNEALQGDVTSTVETYFKKFNLTRLMKNTGKGVEDALIEVKREKRKTDFVPKPNKRGVISQKDLDRMHGEYCSIKILQPERIEELYKKAQIVQKIRNRYQETQ